ncbi:MAG: hypothetical protein ISR89_10155 [Candidatus Marinimicrobia bacterium]|nr:hypothetical protein [Candidatus Neomarinimicrobiota bacterium]MBL7031515.1 hypothetical protein [Candidatus Neomarinimicrobiota bacterium]
MSKYNRINITLPGAVSEELEIVSKELNSKKSHIISEALELYFDELDLAIAEKRLNELEYSKDKTVPAEDVWKELGIH